MSRLEQHQKKQLTTTIIFTLLVLITIIVLMATFGIKFLFDTSVFIAKLAEKKTAETSLKKNTNFIGSVDIDTIPAATNAAKIIVGGSVINFNQLEFYINKILVKKAELNSSDSFREEIGDLKTGENEVFVIAKSKTENQQKKSKVFNVIFKSEKPKLQITQPQDNAKVVKQEIAVIGITDKDTFIKINDLPVVVDAQGNFQTTLKLKDGENKIQILAQDLAGNIESKTITITYQKEE